MTEGQRERAAQFEQKALSLRTAGHTHAEISEMLGISIEKVKKAIARAMRAIRSDKAEMAREALELDSNRLDALIKANWVKAMAGDTKAGSLILQVVDRRAKMLGTDAPVRSVEVAAVANSAPFNFQALDTTQVAELAKLLDAGFCAAEADAMELADEMADYPEAAIIAANAITRVSQ